MSPERDQPAEPPVVPLQEGDSNDRESWGEEDRASGTGGSDQDARASVSTAPAAETHRRVESPNMLPARERQRSGLERLIVRVIATCGVVGIGVAIAAILVSNKTQGWIVGLVVAIVSVVLSALLWSSRQL